VDPKPSTGAASLRALLVETGEYLCALPINQVRQVVSALPVHPLPGASPELLGLAEFTGEPIAVLDLGRLVGAPTGARPANPVTVIVWAGPPHARELVGLAADAALEIVEIAPADIAGAGAGLVGGEIPVGGRPATVLNLEALGTG
jgi:purine-binding chemotaxis protein CheW